MPLGRNGGSRDDTRAMANDALCWMSAVDLAAAIASKKVSPLEVVDAVLDRIERLKHLNAYCLVDRDGARRAARGRRARADRRGVPRWDRSTACRSR